MQASLTFVTGAHALKVGFNDTWGGRHATYDSPAEVGLTYRFNTVNGVTTPNLITEYATPYSNSENLQANLGLYAQDKWTLKRLTLNLGVRFDYFNNYFPESSLGTGPLVPNRNLTFPESAFVSWKDVSPRLGRGLRRVRQREDGAQGEPEQVHGRAGAAGHLRRSGRSDRPPGEHGHAELERLPVSGRRSAPRQFRARLRLDESASRTANAGSMSNTELRQHDAGDHLRPRALVGWGKRPVQLGVLDRASSTKCVPRVSIDVGYFRRWYGNFTVTDNLRRGADRLQPVQRHRADRSAAAGRRRLR